MENTNHKKEHMKRLCELCHLVVSELEFPKEDHLGWCYDCLNHMNIKY